MRTLLLDSGYSPVKIVGWQKAMILFLTGRAEVVEEHGDVDIRSISESYKLPKVLRLFSHFQKFHRVKFNRNNVFLRDKFQCQYCLTELKVKQLTLDHVVPRSRGGKTEWENVVTCCPPCNHKKGNKMPEEFSLALVRGPQRPRWGPGIALRLDPADPENWPKWLLTA